MPDEPESTKLRDAAILAVVAALSAGGGGGLSALRGNESIEVRISVIEARNDILWEAEKARVARQLGETRW